MGRYKVGCTLTLCYRSVLSDMITFYIYIDLIRFLDEKNEYHFLESKWEDKYVLWCSRAVI